jgi:hypothetical protein
MSSWANRGVPVKRNLSQVPEFLRPSMVSRMESPLVVLSEQMQKQLQTETTDRWGDRGDKNEIVYPNQPRGNLADKKVKEDPMNTEKLLKSFTPSIPAIELTHNNKSFVFVILRHIRNSRDNELWISCYNSIRKFYSNKIVIIDDNSLINTVNGKLVNTEIIQSEFAGAGEILPYYYFLKNKWADKMVFLHDSMMLYKPFQPSEIENDVMFHWHILRTESINHKKMISYLSLLSQNDELIKFYNESPVEWKGCFGSATIIDRSVVQDLEDKYQLFSILVMTIRNRKDRETFERVFGMILWHAGQFMDRCSNYGDITKYPNCFESYPISYAVRNVEENQYDTSIVKMWSGR